MGITVNIYYSGEEGAARAFAEEMVSGGTVQAIRDEPGNLRYEYYFPMEQAETLLLIDSWADQEALDRHHHSPMMETIARLREKYDLHMQVERFVSAPELPVQDSSYIRKQRKNGTWKKSHRPPDGIPSAALPRSLPTITMMCFSAKTGTIRTLT